MIKDGVIVFWMMSQVMDHVKLLKATRVFPSYMQSLEGNDSLYFLFTLNDFTASKKTPEMLVTP